MRRTVLATALLALTAPASAQVIRADYQHTRSQFGGEPMLVESGSHFFADDGRYRHDRLEMASGELVSEIRLPRTRERIVMRRQAQAPVGFAARAWGFVNTLVNVLLYGRPSYDYDTAVESRENRASDSSGNSRSRGCESWSTSRPDGAPRGRSG